MLEHSARSRAALTLSAPLASPLKAADMAVKAAVSDSLPTDAAKSPAGTPCRLGMALLCTRRMHSAAAALTPGAGPSAVRDGWNSSAGRSPKALRCVSNRFTARPPAIKHAEFSIRTSPLPYRWDAPRKRLAARSGDARRSLSKTTSLTSTDSPPVDTIRTMASANGRPPGLTTTVGAVSLPRLACQSLLSWLKCLQPRPMMMRAARTGGASVIGPGPRRRQRPLAGQLPARCESVAVGATLVSCAEL